MLIVETTRGRDLIEKRCTASAADAARTQPRRIAAALDGKPYPHLVLLDAMLPDTDGFDVLNRIRQHSATENLPVLMLTALGERKDVTRGLRLGADGYITKPVLPSTLLKAVEAIIAA